MIRAISNQDSVDKSELYCNDCEEHTDQVQESELLEKIKEWWGQTEFREMERITGFSQSDFNPNDGYQAFVDACENYWESLSLEEKIEHWKSDSTVKS